MDYREYKPQSDLTALVKCYWILEVPPEGPIQRQRILPDGCIEMIFILGDDIKRYTSDNSFIIQPPSFVLGQITKPFFVEPTGRVCSFGVRFYPYGFANFISTPIRDLANTEMPLSALFGTEAAEILTQRIINAFDAEARIEIVEEFLIERLENKVSIHDIVQVTIDTMLLTKGGTSIKAMLKDDISKRRQLERKFIDQIGLSPKQLSRVIRLQTALKMMLESHPDDLSGIAYRSDYYDQAHYIKDFKEFTGLTPKKFSESEEMKLSSLFYME